MKRACLLGVFFCVVAVAQAQLTRVPNTTLKMPPAPPALGYTLQTVSPHAFTAPVALATPPGETNRLFIVEQSGRISVITNITAATPTYLTFLDIQSRVGYDGGEQGLLGLAFHPDYKNNGYFFVFYVTSGTRMDRLSRFKVSDANANIADPNSETILISQPDDYSNHNAGDLHFGADGYLYVSLGDEGGGGDSGRNSQRIDKDFFSGMLRIDVDKKPDSLAPNPHPASSTNYAVPADNPFVGATNFNGIALADPSKVRTEFWAVGLRNPWRYSFDPLTGALWCGDVGQDAYEEVDIITKGGNYGWNYREGLHAYTGTPPAGFKAIDPIYEYPHANGNNCVIGGVVYRGARFSQLYGAYVFGDNGSGNIWAMRLNDQGKGVVQQIASNLHASGFGVDPSNGDVLVCTVSDGRIRRLVYSTNSTGAAIPLTLADTGAFSDLATLTPADGIVPYQVNLPFWSDGAKKTRWFSIPNGTDKLTFNPTNAWLTPTGAVWIKHFDMEMTKGDANSARRLETRFIVRNTNGVYGVTYRWTNSTSAVLVPEEGLDEALAINEGGTVRTQVWHYPSRSECLVCHNPAAGLVLGFNTPQMNCDETYGAVTTNQLTALANAGYLDALPAPPHSYLALAKPDDATVSQEFRVRSYLAANCSQCHRPGGSAVANFDTRISTATDDANLINGALIDNLGDTANKTLVPNSPEHSAILLRMSVRGPKQMPPLASNIPDASGTNLVRAFVAGDLANRENFAQWQSAHFTQPLPPEAAPTADPDADGASNMLEFMTGTNPAQAGDAWGIQVTTDQNGLNISFSNPANRAVVIETATSIPPIWTPVDDPNNQPNFPAAAATRTVSDSLGNETMRLYRARIISP